MVTFDEIDETILWNIIRFVSYADIANLLITNKKLNQLVIRIIHDYTIPNLDRDIYKGIITILKRYSPDRGISTDLRWDAPLQDAPPINQAIYEDVIRALGWRKFSSALKLNKAEWHNRITLSELKAEIITHAQLTSKLRALTAHKSFPKRSYIGKEDDHLYLKEVDVKLLTEHWNYIYNQIGNERNYHANDTLALSLAKNEGLMGGGQNVSVVGGAPSLIYTNNPLAAGKVHDLESKYRPHTVAGISQEGDVSRNGLGVEHGVGRKYGRYPDLPFHSEMLRLLDKEPWELSYAGNSYLACAQCLVSYFAIGVTLFRGSHLQKVPSIIPPRIRQNTVYLEQYLGEPLFRKITAEFGEDLSQLTSFLDYIERYDTNFYGAYKQIVRYIPLMGRKPAPPTPPPAITAGVAPSGVAGAPPLGRGRGAPPAPAALSSAGRGLGLSRSAVPAPPIAGVKRPFSATVTAGAPLPPTAGAPKRPARSCPTCSSRLGSTVFLQLKEGRFGSFYGCPNFIYGCKYTESA